MEQDDEEATKKEEGRYGMEAQRICERQMTKNIDEK